MHSASSRDRADETVTVRYWAGARAAAGTAEDRFDAVAGLTLAGLVAQVLQRHPGDRMARTVGVCSVLVGEQPVGTRDPASVALEAGAVVELLPPPPAAERHSREQRGLSLPCQGTPDLPPQIGSALTTGSQHT